MSLAGTAARGATVQLPLGQLALVGLGFFFVSNPNKLLQTLAASGKLLQAADQSTNSGGHHQPIIIHQAAPASASRGGAGYAIQLLMSVGMCWGGYVVLVSVLPEAAKGMLPVNKSVFNKAVGKLGTALINLKDTVLVQIESLSGKQDELGAKQDATHGEVLEVKTNVKEMRTDLSVLQEALDLCRESLSESDRRTSFIARGVQLLTRSVSTILPDQEHLLQELMQYNLSGSDFINSPVAKEEQKQRLQEAIQTIQAHGTSSYGRRASGGTPAPSTPNYQRSSSAPNTSSHPSYTPVDYVSATATPVKSVPPEILPIDEDENTVSSYGYEAPQQCTVQNSTSPVLALFKDLGLNTRVQYAS